MISSLSSYFWCQRFTESSVSDISTNGKSLCGDDGVLELDDTLTTLIGVKGGGGGVGLGQATVTTCSGSGDQQLSDNQHPITTVTTPINNASIM